MDNEFIVSGNLSFYTCVDKLNNMHRLESGAFYILVHVLNLTFNILSSQPDLFNKPNEFLIAAGAFNTLLNVIAVGTLNSIR